MLLHLSRSSRAGLALVARSARCHGFARTFIAPTISRRADFVQELYLKELKAYKVPQVKENDSAGQVLTFKLPKTPASPEEADLASNLKEYENMAVDIEGQSPSSQSTPPAPFDWLEEDEPEGH
ncbi:hypothetical protein CDD81_2137 [Ophiocordyceps australis]|uniref:ATP synthase subunit H, mitochondrial n=1 Tax=Ophiocordyceps australis TaxID=1399860 RepID=A0A2C5XXH5_9HYPO|nr:hypothetical protein CDD81_2137 [Ophiocordyceps australis]